MSFTTLISYDGTLNDLDALALGRMLRSAGAELVLAYVRHPVLAERSREELEEHEAEALLERGARWLGDLGVERRIVLNASTSEGLRLLAEELGAKLIVFGSDYRTPAGRVAPQASAQKLLEDGSVAVAIAPAGYGASHEHDLERVTVLAEAGDAAPAQTAESLASALEASVTGAPASADLLIIGSRPQARSGRVLLSASAQHALEEASAPVCVLARNAPLAFRAPLYLS